jgi:truncated hemoglobin YjbI
VNENHELRLAVEMEKFVELVEVDKELSAIHKTTLSKLVQKQFG